MNINWNKTHDMIFESVKDLIAQRLRVEELDIQRFDSFNLLGLICIVIEGGINMWSLSVLKLHNDCTI